MKFHHALATFATSFVVLGCIKSEPIGGPQGVRNDVGKTYVQKSSGFEFPVQVGGQKRGDITQYDPAGTDISASYDSDQPPIALTVYVYPVPPKTPKDVLAWHFDYCKSEVVRTNPRAKLLSEAPIAIVQAGTKQTGMRANYSFAATLGGRNQLCRSELDLFVHKGQFILYRMTYPESEEAVSRKAVERFFRSFAWPGPR